jgi:hypothetical protein
VLRSLGEDNLWHREWAAALTRILLEDFPENAGVIRAMVRRFAPDARLAVLGLERAAGFSRGTSLEETSDFDADGRELLASLGLDEVDHGVNEQPRSLEGVSP